MRTASMSLEQFKAEQAERNVSADDRLKRLTGGSERLKTHSWTDEKLQAIPEDMVQLAFEQSTALQREFGDLAKLQAYRKALAAGRARIAGKR